VIVVHDHGFVAFLGVLFLAALVGQALTGIAQFNIEQITMYRTDHPRAVRDVFQFRRRRGRELVVGVPAVLSLHLATVARPAGFPGVEVTRSARHRNRLTGLGADPWVQGSRCTPAPWVRNRIGPRLRLLQRHSLLAVSLTFWSRNCATSS